MIKILIIEDDLRFAEALKSNLQSKYDVLIAESVPTALGYLGSRIFDAVLCDYKIENDDCFSVLSFIRSLGSQPKFFVMTGYTALDMAVRLLNEKIDGYFEKPLAITDITDRIDKEFSSLTNRQSNELSINPFEKILTIDNQQIQLTDVEFRILGFLINQKEKWVSRKDIITFVWKGPTISRNTLDTHLSNLKRKVPKLKSQIKVARGKGYYYSPTVLKPNFEK